jgi:hypothetical protein
MLIFYALLSVKANRNWLVVCKSTQFYGTLSRCQIAVNQLLKPFQIDSKYLLCDNFYGLWDVLISSYAIFNYLLNDNKSQLQSQVVEVASW